MSMFQLHFFKEKSRLFDYERLLSFFDEISEAKMADVSETSNEVRIEYRHPVLRTKADFVISRKSTVTDIYKLDPQYLDVNFRLEMPLMTPLYSAKKVFEIVDKMCKEFSFSIYHNLFEDVLRFKYEVVEKVFDIDRKKYREKYGYQLSNIYYYPDHKLNDCLKYVDEQYDLHRYYKELDVYVPNYFVVIDEQDKVHFTMEWRENTLTLFPPHIDYIYYRQGLDNRILPFDEVMAKIEKMTTSVPGFLQNTKVVEHKSLKKIMKVLKKTKFTPVNGSLVHIELDQVMDI
ncbi:hypothetical protein JN09_000914 [Acholeplasma morum]|uniref:hypothetical protein n=1 Tax=Paracholeplasma morum TaxID=264637 RepID=UPI001957B203|nr:hypothetical protein [Paracholeplasma morum]MBM7453584.1 hypothetical protein [Paracholeplasma morum]